MKILITNIVTLNAGDAAILYAMIDVLREAFGKEIQFIVYDKHGEVAGRYYPNIVFRKLIYLSRQSAASSLSNKFLKAMDEIRFRVGLWAVKHSVPLIPGAVLSETELRDLLEYKSADLIVSSGGTYLVENYSLAARIFDYQLSLYFGKPLVFFTQSLGPFSNESNRKSLLPIFDNSAAILLRDKQSLENLTELGVKNANVHIAADAAFALSEIEAVESAKSASERTGRLKVAISVREWRHFKKVDATEGMNRYSQAIRALVGHLIERYNAEITFLSTCQGMPEYWTDDSKVAQTIVDGLCDKLRDSVAIDSSFHDPVVLAQKLKHFDLVIATRMHMAILALGVGRPVFPIAYEFKMRELFERLGQGHWVQDIETISAATLTNELDRFLESLPEIREPLFTAVLGERENAIASGHVVTRAFDRWRQANHDSRG